MACPKPEATPFYGGTIVLEHVRALPVAGESRKAGIAMIDVHVWLCGLIGAIIHLCPPSVKYRLQCTGRNEDDLAQQVCLRLIAKNGMENPENGDLSWEGLAELVEDLLKAKAAGIGFKETKAYQRIKRVVSCEVYRTVNGSTAGKRRQRKLPQEVHLPESFDPVDQHRSQGNHPKRRNGGKLWNGKPYDLTSRFRLPMASEFRDMLIDFEQGFGDFSKRELEILRGSMDGKTVRELGNELGIRFQLVSEIRERVFEKLKELYS